MPPPPTVAWARQPESARASGAGGVSAAMFAGFLGLGVLALLVGGLLGGLFGGGPPSALETPSPSPSPTLLALPSPTLSVPPTAAQPTPTSVPTPEGPTVFPDGFTAMAEPCLEEPTRRTCGSSGATNAGHVWILVSFRHAKPEDLVEVVVLASDGRVVGTNGVHLRSARRTRTARATPTSSSRT